MNGPRNPEDLPTIPYDLDDDLMNLTRGDQQPRVRVYPWEGVAVVIGRGGKQHLELDRAAIAADGVPLLKRPGGGCAVVLDPGNVIVSVVLPLPGLSGITTAFGAISSWLAAALEQLDLGPVVQRGVSDLVVGDRKIGGSCIYRTRNLLYYSTTLLVQPDLDLVERYLPHPPREPDYRQGRNHRDFMGHLGWEGKSSELTSKLQKRLFEGLGTLSESLTNV